LTRFSLKSWCAVCGNGSVQSFEIPAAPTITEQELTCTKCGNRTFVLLTSCPSCQKSFKYFFTDFDFSDEIKRVSGAYVDLIRGIRDSLSEHISEFDVQLPKRWSVKLTCECGNEYSADIPLLQLE